MIVRRRTWTYRLSEHEYARTVSFDVPLSAQKARQFLMRTFGTAPLEIWGNPVAGHWPTPAQSRR